MSPRHSYYLPARKLVSQDDAAVIANPRIPRSKFHNRWNHLTTFDAGELVPFMVDEILPGDHMRYNITAYLRMATALFPLFSNQRVDIHLFYTPSRILWQNWNQMHGEQPNPSSSIAYTVPTISVTNVNAAVCSIYDYMGLPISNLAGGEAIDVNALPFRAYNRIYNDWFRDQNIIDSAPNRFDNGPDAAADYTLRKRAKPHDYFTSALPWPQKFTPLQTLFTGTAPVKGIGAIEGTAVPNVAGSFREADNTTQAYAGLLGNNFAGNAWGIRFDSAANVSSTNPPVIYADLAQATGVTINALRNAWLVQDLLERDARGGTRYTEIIRSHFGVISPDFRLQRPEYIGGGQTPINITPIAQTATGGGGLGALGGAGTAASGNNFASYAATEHGYILGLISVRTELAYQQGLHRMWTKSTRYDFYYPALAGLGEQSILRQEIYATGASANDPVVFGYQERWHEYRTRYSEVSGLFRSTSAGNIDEWHLAEQFSAAPTLSQTFIEDATPMSRVLSAGASADNSQYLADILIERTAVRPLTMFGTPATLSRF